MVRLLGVQGRCASSGQRLACAAHLSGFGSVRVVEDEIKERGLSQPFHGSVHAGDFCGHFYRMIPGMIASSSCPHVLYCDFRCAAACVRLVVALSGGINNRK